MSDENNDDEIKIKRYKMEEGLYAVDSYGRASEGERMKRLANKFAEEAEKLFDPDKLKDTED